MKKTNIIVIFIMAIAFSFSACSNKTESTKKSTTEVVPKEKVKIALVTRQDVPQISEYAANIEPDIKNNIAPAAPGRIRDIFVKVGKRVKKGDRLAQMDVANLSNSESQISNLRRNYKRTSELFAVGGASQQELDNAKLQLVMAETNLKNLSENTYLLSPIDGVITARNYDAGDMYTGQMPILTVMKINPVKLKINVSESNFTKVKIGMPVDITLEIYPNLHFTGKVSLIYPTIDDRTRTFTVEITLANKNLKVRPGMFARAKVNFGTKNHIVVPDLSVVKESGSGARYVFVYKNGKVSLTQVKLGVRTGNNFEILSGLKDDDQIVTAGQSRLVDGSEVEVVK